MSCAFAIDAHRPKAQRRRALINEKREVIHSDVPRQTIILALE